MSDNRAVTIRPFEDRDADAFRRLNHAWITRYFVLEDKDNESLDHPQTAILDPGGEILMAEAGDRPVGCVALMAMGGDRFELAKMAVDDGAQGLGIGRALMDAAIAWARERGAKQLYLESNTRLTPALTLYRSVGFRTIEDDTPSPYARANIRMILDL